MVENIALNTDENKWRFIHAQILSSSLAASFQRSNVYLPNIQEMDRINIRKIICKELEIIGDKYKESISEEEHKKIS